VKFHDKLLPCPLLRYCFL